MPVRRAPNCIQAILRIFKTAARELLCTQPSRLLRAIVRRAASLSPEEESAGEGRPASSQSLRSTATKRQLIGQMQTSCIKHRVPAKLSTFDRR